MALKKYSVKVEERLIRDIEVSAVSHEEAEQFVRDMYEAETLILDSSDHFSTEFTALER